MASLNTGLKRIEKLADFMETVPRQKFDFSVIIGDNWGGKPDLSCGTTACALGWATAMPLFRKLGLYLNKNTKQVEIDGSGYSTGWSSIAEKVFGIDDDAMLALFDPSHTFCDESPYPALSYEATPKQWAKHARRIVKILRKENNV